MTEPEKKLLRQQAEAYAFIHNLRKTAITLADSRYIRMTEGIEATITLRQAQYPTMFKRYFNAALKKAEKSVVVLSRSDGKRKEIPQRQEVKEKEIKRTKGTRGNLGTGVEKKTSRKKKTPPPRGIKRPTE